MPISIHAPTRGATSCYLCLMISVMIFQSTLPREERLYSVCIGYGFIQFQSTLPREERLNFFLAVRASSIFQSTLPREERPVFQSSHRKRVHNFNPRSHERSDIVPVKIGGFEIISIHAPTRGATCRINMIRQSSYFNPRSHERSDSNIAQKICLFLYNTDNKYIIR